MRLWDKISRGEVYFIAEMSANHGGKLENALEIVQAAKEAGADCLKIQTYTADTMTINSTTKWFKIKGGLWDGYNLYQLYEDAYTPWEWQCAIKEKCDELEIDFISTPFDVTAVDFLEGLECEAYKIASFELVDIPLIEYVASKGKPIIISCGMGSVEEIQDAVEACKRMGNEMVILLKCCSSYPADWKDMNLSTIQDMKNRFGVSIGLSDHSMGSLAAVVGASQGACVVEKHFCLSREIKTCDSEFSMEPEEFATMIKEVNAAKAIIGEVSYDLNSNEKQSMVFRRSLFVVKDIKKGEPFTTENIKVIRPGYGILPKYRESVLNMKAKKNIMAGTPLTFELCEEESIVFLTNNENTTMLYEWLCNREEYVIHFKEKISLEIIKAIKPKFIISFNYKHIIDEDIIEYMGNRIINLHISYLPYNRGWAPNYFSFIEDTPKGVTIHRVDKGLDTGEILCQKEMFFDEGKETFSTSYNKLIDEICELFKENWNDIKCNKIEGIPQPKKGTYHTKKQLQEIYDKSPFSWHEIVADYKKRGIQAEKEC
ncbi:pseudaminic acid synthase [Cellulosilyticum sp. WCF-2]|uniref:pseudaminic acid synthase n=1 Tax=Cellulosilyticum sp. WCF-2 TaxID=2497860 RepID=UPI000F8DF08E|nr:pseudaminic acid synthase [Cellulosilyticum sp. WCF-2]